MEGIELRFNKVTLVFSLVRGWGFQLIKIGFNLDRAGYSFSSIFALWGYEFWVVLRWGDLRKLQDSKSPEVVRFYNLGYKRGLKDKTL
tara:strand:- start:19284 stop:19547 length:264 start_codon:yes stop_codon:yes gene_type:complete